jgi:putative ABC transport system permease protein
VRFTDVFSSALGQIRANKLRSFFTLLGVIVSVTFLVAVVAIIQGMNAYVRENVAGAIIGANSFQVRRTPINFARFSDDEWRRAQRRPKVGPQDAELITAAIHDAEAISLQSGWPTPQADVVWGNRSLGDALIFGVTPAYQTVQDYRIASGRPLLDVDIAERRAVCEVRSGRRSRRPTRSLALALRTPRRTPGSRPCRALRARRPARPRGARPRAARARRPS